MRLGVGGTKWMHGGCNYSIHAWHGVIIFIVLPSQAHTYTHCTVVYQAFLEERVLGRNLVKPLHSEVVAFSYV